VKKKWPHTQEGSQSYRVLFSDNRLIQARLWDLENVGSVP